MSVATVAHPAKFSAAILERLAALNLPMPCLDPFGGLGKLHQVYPQAICLDIEPEWARVSGDLVGDATYLPFADGTFASGVTSPTYGNRMADHHDARDGSRRHTYRHTLGRPLHARNSGQMQWGPDYRSLHWLTWCEIRRVLKPGALFALNCSDHIRAGQRQYVCAWHAGAMLDLGFALLDTLFVPTPRQRHGQNGSARVEAEQIMIFQRDQ